MINDIVEVKLNGKSYRAKLDMGAIASSQLKIDIVKENTTVPQMIDLVSKENYTVINTILIESIKRCHPQLTDENILENMKLNEKNEIIGYVIELFSVSLPKENKKKSKKKVK